MHVIIDTNIYRSDPKRRSAGFRAIARLGAANRIQLHIPHYIHREFVTQQEDEGVKALEKLKQAVSSLKRLSDQEEVTSAAEAIHEEVETLEEHLDDHLSAEFSTWLGNAHANLLPIAGDHGQRVSDSYFAGDPPFSERKSRKDIPDAFIYESLKDLVATHPELHLITADKLFRTAAAKLVNVRTYESIDEFIATPACQTLLTEANAALNIDRIKTILPEETRVLEGALQNHIIDPLDGYKVHDSTIPDDNREATVSGVGEPTNTTFDFNAVEYYGDGNLAIPFNSRVECELDYYIYKGELTGIQEERLEGISTIDWNDHYYLATETFDLNVEGRLIIDFSLEELQRDDLEEEDLRALINDSDATVEIENAAIRHEYPV
jgi:hypothetical protein